MKTRTPSPDALVPDLTVGSASHERESTRLDVVRHWSLMASAMSSILLSLATTGCWPSTLPLAAARGEPDHMGFGLAEHTRYVGSPVRSTGQAAAVDPLDSVWVVYDGGTKLRHCHFDGKSTHDCQLAELGEKSPEFWEDPLIIIDPENLGSFAVQRTFCSGSDRLGGCYTTWVGSAIQSERTVRPTSAHGIWVKSKGTGYQHCHLEGGRPRCTAVPVNTMYVERALGVFTVGEIDVLWVAVRADVFSVTTSIVRCTAGPREPVPTCAVAQTR